jgi:hypothetical protein
MPPSLKTRKPIDQLKPEDLIAFPVWEFASDEEEDEEQDETWVRPHLAKMMGPDLYDLSVAADFLASSGQTFTGFIGVTTAGDLEFGHGVLLHENTHIFVPSAEYPQAKKERKAVAAALRVKESQVFPLKFTLRVLLQGEVAPRHGEFA